MTPEHMKIGKFSFRIRAIEDLFLPAYKGSTLRGGFGQALKSVVCALRRQECRTCLLRGKCVYLYLFETPPPTDAEMMRLYPAAPHPFVIEPPVSVSRAIPAGGSMDFGLILVGRALDYLAYFTYAFIRFGERGLGRGRGKFEVEAIAAAGENGPVFIYEGDDRTLRQPPIFDAAVAVANRVEALAGTERLTLEFITPTRIKFAEKLVEKPEFHHLIRSLLRRISSLSYFHCGAKLELDFRGLIERAQAVSCSNCSLHWVDWERYSSRQK